MSEMERLKMALEATREHNRKLIAENKRLREGAGLLTPDPNQKPVEVKVHPDLMPPPPPPPPVRHQVKPGKWRESHYAGDKPLRTQWPLEERHD
jgi:hypothetical protein